MPIIIEKIGNKTVATKYHCKMKTTIYEGKIIASKTFGIIYIESVLPMGEVVIQNLSKLFLDKRLNVKPEQLSNSNDEKVQNKIDFLNSIVGNLTPLELSKEPKIISFADEYNLDKKSFANKLKLYNLAQEIYS